MDGYQRVSVVGIYTNIAGGIENIAEREERDGAGAEGYVDNRRGSPLLGPDPMEQTE